MTRSSSVRASARALALAALLLACLVPAASATVAAIPGDYPDPTVTRVGDQYLATATSDRWEPVFPLMSSPDLRTWTQVGAVFDRAPAWATGNRFWAPELTTIDGGLLLTYSGLKRSGQWCIGVATASSPQGPWVDHGPRLCPANGVIDSWVTRDDETGAAYLLYKAKGIDGALYGTPFDLRTLAPFGAPVELVRPEQGDKGVTEGPALVHRGGWWYLLFSTGNCCRPPCTYVERVARSRTPLGPYDRMPRALLTNDGSWRCLGHGTPVVAPDGGLALLHHAYPATDPLELRRWAVLTRLQFDEDDWPEAVGADAGGAGPTAVPIADDFAASRLSPAWQWPARRARPVVATADGRLQLACGPAGLIARQTVSNRFDVAASVFPESSGSPVVGVRDRAGIERGLEVRDGRVRAVRRSATSALGAGPPISVPPGEGVRVRLAVSPGGVLQGFVRVGGIERRVVMGAAGTGGPPVRVALSCSGAGTARFSSLRLVGAVAPAAPAPPEPPTVGASIVAAASRAGLLTD